jgi:hypothetical protein
MSTEKRSTGRIIAIVVGVLVILCLCCILAAGVAYWQRDQLGELLPRDLAELSGLAPQIGAANMMPADTPLYWGMSLNLQNQAGYLNLKKIYLDNPDVQNALNGWMADFEEETSLNFENDIQPWLGTEAALAFASVTDLDEFESAEIVLAISTRDVAASEAFLQKLRDQEAEDGRPFEQDEYQGITYWFYAPDSEFETPAYTAIFNDFVIWATSKQTFFNTIDRVKSGDESLADNAEFQTVMEALPSNGALFGFMDWGIVADLALRETPVQLEPEQMSQLEAFQSIGLALTLQPDGIQIDTAIQFDAEKLSEAARATLNRPSTPNQVLNRIPVNAIGFVNSSDLHGVWQQAREGLAASPDFEQQLEDLEAEIGLNLDEDIFGWMTGEYTLVVTEAQPTDEFAPPIGGYLLIGTEDMNLAQEKVAKLVDLVAQEMFVEFQSQTISGHEMQIILDPFTESVTGGYGFWDDYFVAGYLEDALLAAFGAPNDSVSNSSYFQAVSSRLPGQNYGYFYVDIDAVQRLVESEMSEFEREDYENDIRPFVDPLRALGVASSPPQDGIQSVTMFLLITEE